MRELEISEYNAVSGGTENKTVASPQDAGVCFIATSSMSLFFLGAEFGPLEWAGIAASSVATLAACR